MEWKGEVEMIDYVALSHRWGLHCEFILTKQDIAELQIKISIESVWCHDSSMDGGAWRGIVSHQHARPTL